MTESDIQPLRNELKLIRDGQVSQSTMLGQHMANSANNHESLKCEIAAINLTLTKAVADTREIYNSLPEDDHGRASPFIHKTHHGLKDEFYVAKMGDRRVVEKESFGDMIKRIWLERLVSGAFIALIFILGLGVKDYLAHPAEVNAHIVKEVAK